MIYKCKNCDGNMIYHVEERKLFCTYCNSFDTEKLIDCSDISVCDSCGGKIAVGQYDSAGKCPYCSQYIIYKGRVEGEYKPSKILPFKVGKGQAKTMIRIEYQKKLYAPKSFLSEASLEKMEGIYVPFWLYNINADFNFHGTGYRERIVSDDNMLCKEISCFDVYRKFDAAFRRIPVDASIKMPDNIMDMMEPYDYSELEVFEPKYISGFFAEIYSDDVKKCEERALGKIVRDSQKLLDKELSNFIRVIPIESDIKMKNKGEDFVLLPVWKYLYSYRGTEYEYYVNGQTGKVIGEAPISIGKRIAYGSTVFLSVLLGMWMLLAILFGV